MSSAAFAALRAAKKSQPQRYIRKKPHISRNRRDLLEKSRKKVATAIPYKNKAAKKSQPQSRRTKKPQKSQAAKLAIKPLTSLVEAWHCWTYGCTFGAFVTSSYNVQPSGTLYYSCVNRRPWAYGFYLLYLECLYLSGGPPPCSATVGGYAA